MSSPNNSIRNTPLQLSTPLPTSMPLSASTSQRITSSKSIVNLKSIDVNAATWTKFAKRVGDLKSTTSASISSSKVALTINTFVADMLSFAYPLRSKTVLSGRTFGEIDLRRQGGQKRGDIGVSSHDCSTQPSRMLTEDGWRRLKVLVGNTSAGGLQPVGGVYPAGKPVNIRADSALGVLRAFVDALMKDGEVLYSDVHVCSRRSKVTPFTSPSPSQQRVHTPVRVKNPDERVEYIISEAFDESKQGEKGPFIIGGPNDIEHVEQRSLLNFVELVDLVSTWSCCHRVLAYLQPIISLQHSDNRDPNTPNTTPTLSISSALLTLLEDSDSPLGDAVTTMITKARTITTEVLAHGLIAEDAPALTQLSCGRATQKVDGHWRRKNMPIDPLELWRQCVDRLVASYNDNDEEVVINRVNKTDRIGLGNVDRGKSIAINSASVSCPVPSLPSSHDGYLLFLLAAHGRWGAAISLLRHWIGLRSHNRSLEESSVCSADATSDLVSCMQSLQSTSRVAIPCVQNVVTSLRSYRQNLGFLNEGLHSTSNKPMSSPPGIYHSDSDWHCFNLESVTFVNPTHFAILDHQTEFISLYSCFCSQLLLDASHSLVRYVENEPGFHPICASRDILDALFDFSLSDTMTSDTSNTRHHSYDEALDTILNVSTVARIVDEVLVYYGSSSSGQDDLMCWLLNKFDLWRHYKRSSSSGTGKRSKGSQEKEKEQEEVDRDSLVGIAVKTVAKSLGLSSFTLQQLYSGEMSVESVISLMRAANATTTAGDHVTPLSAEQPTAERNVPIMFPVLHGPLKGLCVCEDSSVRKSFSTGRYSDKTSVVCNICK